MSTPTVRQIVRAYHEHEPRCREHMRWIMSKETLEEFGRQLGAEPKTDLPLEEWTMMGLRIDLVEGFAGVALGNMVRPATWESGDGPAPSA